MQHWSIFKPLKKLGTLLVFSLLGLSSSHAQPVSSADHTAFVLQHMALDAVIQELPNSVASGLQGAIAQGMPMPPEVATTIVEQAQQHFAWVKLQPQLHTAINQHLSRKQLEAWVNFYQTTLGQKMAAADRKGSSAEVMQHVMQRGPEILTRLAGDTTRMALVQSLVDATHALDRATDTSAFFALTLDWAIVSSMPNHPDKPTFEQLENEIATQRFVIRSQMAQMVLAHTALVYQDFSTAELQSVLQQVTSPSGQALYKNFGDAFEALLKTHAQSFGVGVSNALSSKGI